MSLTCTLLKRRGNALNHNTLHICYLQFLNVYIQQINNALCVPLLKGEKNESSVMSCLARLAENFSYLSI